MMKRKRRDEGRRGKTKQEKERREESKGDREEGGGEERGRKDGSWPKSKKEEREQSSVAGEHSSKPGSLNSWPAGLLTPRWKHI